ncbi:hypothetical protein MHU86_18919 [Fragilaria crotonensis]|nr:hypothetical protein MHU86_18919 [Fragilaria crotonensis]
MDEPESTRRRKSKKSEEDGEKERRKSKSKHAKKKKDADERHGDEAKKKKKRKSSTSDRNGGESRESARRHSNVERSMERSSMRSSDNVLNGMSESPAAQDPRRSTLVPNLANLVGSFSNLDAEEPLKGHSHLTPSNIEEEVGLLRERDNRKREATRRFSTGEQSRGSSVPAEYSEMTGSRDSSPNSIYASIEKANQNTFTRSAAASSGPSARQAIRSSHASYASSNGASRVGAVAVTGGSQTGKRGPSISASSEAYAGNHQRPGFTAVSGPAPRGKSDMRNTSDSRVGASHVSGAAPKGKGRPVVSVASIGESYDSRVGAVAVPSAAPPGKRSSSWNSSAGHPGSQDSRVGAVAMSAPAPRGKGGPSVSSGAETYNSSGVGAVAVSAPAPRGKRRLSSSSGADSHASSSVGAVALNAPAPRGKGGPSVSSGAEAYTSNSVGAVNVKAPAPRGKGGPSFSSGAETYDSSAPSNVGAVSVSHAAPKGKGTASGAFDHSNRVGAVSVLAAAPKGKRPRYGSSSAPPAPTEKSTSTSLEAGGVLVSTAAVRQSGRLSISSESGSNDTDDSLSTGALWSSIQPTSTRDVSNQAGAMAVKGAPSTSKTSKEGRISIMEGRETYDDGVEELKIGARATKRAGKLKREYSESEVNEHGASRRSSVDTANHSEATSQKSRVSHFPTSDLYASLSSFQEPTGDNKGRVSQFPGEENYEEDVEDHAMRRVSRSSDGSGRVRKSGNDGPSYSESGDSYDRDNSRSASGDSYHHEIDTELGSQRSDLVRRRSTGAFFISGQTIREREPGAITTSEQLNAGTFIEAEVTPVDRLTDGISSDDLKSIPWYRSRTFCLITLFLVITGGVLGITLPLVVFRDDSASAPTPSPTIPINPERLAEIRTILSNVTDAETLDDPSSPQNAAFAWIVGSDSRSPVTPGAVSTEESQKVSTRYALATFYYATSGDRWISHLWWLDGDRHECDWEYISCIDYEVTEIDSGDDGKNMVGRIPSEMKVLTSLVGIALQHNRITGIHPDVGLMSDLFKLDLQVNDMEGTLPDFLYAMTSLSILNLQSNRFNGTVSSKVSNMPDLRELYLGLNYLSGTITSELVGLRNLRVLDLSGNRLVGDFHAVVSDLTHLIYIFLENNGFSGKLNGTLMSAFDQLAVLSLETNKLSGTLPTELGSLNSLSNLFLNNNVLSGTIPSELAGALSLEYLGLDANLLTGNVPIELCGLSSLKELVVDCDLACPCLECIPECPAT